AVGPSVGQYGDLVREVLRSEGRSVYVIATADDRDVAVDVQVAVAADAKVPAPPVAGIPEDHPIPFIYGLCAFVHLDVRPTILESGCDHYRTGTKALDGQRFARTARRRRHYEFKPVVRSNKVQEDAAAQVDAYRTGI